MTIEEQVVLCDEAGEKTALMGKTEAHQKGLLHRAISVIVFNKNGEMLLQQRAFSKYHWAGIWSNTCCSHPRDGESFAAAADRRLLEEMGFSTPLSEQFCFVYKAKDEQSGMTEHEYDVVFTGYYDGAIPFNQEEVNAVSWIGVPELLLDVDSHPDKYSFWFKIILQEFLKRGII